MPKRHLLLGVALAITSATFASAQQPTQAGWTGWAVCAITIQGPGYSHSETHRWTITGPGTTQSNMTIYPGTWTVAGQGSLARVSGPTRVAAAWQVNGTLPNVTIGNTRHLDRITIQRWTNHGPARGGLTGTETRTVNGAGTSRPVVLDVQQWAFPLIATASPTSMRVTGSKGTPFDGARGPMAPPGSTGVAKCDWDFARGGESPAAPPAMPAAATPAGSGGTTPSSGGTTSGGGSTSGSAGGAVAGGAAAGGAGAGGATGGRPPAGTTVGSGGGGGSTIAGVAADLHVVVSPSDPTVPFVLSWPAGGTAAYHVTVTNNGPAAANGTVLAIPASAGLSKTSFGCSGLGGAQCPPGLTLNQVEGGFAIPALPAGGTLTLRFFATVTGAIGSNVSVRATVTLPAGVTDPNPSNYGHDSTSHPVVASSGTGGAGSGGGTSGGGSSSGGADLAVVIGPRGTPRPDSWPTNGRAEHQVDVTNNGPRAADGALLFVPPSAGLSGWGNMTCIASGGAVCPSWQVISQVLQNGVAIPTLPAGGSVQVMFFRNVTAAAGTTVSMTATVSAPTGVSDPNPANNSSTETLPVVASTSSSSGGNGGGTPPASGPRPLGLGSAFANETTAPGGVVTATFLPAGAYTDLYWEFSAQDNPSATTASLRFRASITGASAGHTFDVEILERTTSGDVTRSLSGTSQNPTAGITWSNVPGRDDSRVFVVRVRQASGPVSSTPLQLRLDIGGPAGGQ